MQDGLQLLGAVLALLGFGFGLYQFYDAQRWKRSEFAAKQLERLQSDAVLVAATRALDWRSRRLPLPPTLRLAATEECFDHTWDALAEGIKPEQDRATFTRPMEIYRDLFDGLFSYLEEINHYVDIGLVSPTQIKSLTYWLEQLSRPRFGDQVQFGPYIQAYRYPGTVALMRRLGVPVPLGAEAGAAAPGAPSRAALGSAESVR